MFLTKKVPSDESWLKSAYSSIYDIASLKARSIHFEIEETKEFGFELI